MDSVSAEKARIQESYLETIQEQFQPSISIDNSSAMWEYRNRGTIDGIPVSEDARHLYVNSMQQVRDATQLVMETHVWTGYISPKQQDKKTVKEYEDLLKQISNNQSIIIDQEKHFCADIGKLMLIITYADVKKTLHPRYAHLKEEVNQ